MIKELEIAFAEAAKLPEEDQKAFAAWLMEELADERHWNEQFGRSQGALKKLAEEALQEHREGKTIPLDPDQL